MNRPAQPRNHALVRFRAERVVKDDGRYLIYYSWPDEPSSGRQASDGTAGGGARQEPPTQAPWSPETDPADV